MNTHISFSQKTYRRLKSRLRTRYQTKWKKLLTQIRKSDDSVFRDWLIDHSDELSSYTNFNWFYLIQIETYLYLKNQNPEKSKDFNLSRSEEKVFDIWNQSEFADIFLKALNKGQNVAAASKNTLKHFEQHLLVMGKRQIEKVDSFSKSYRIQTGLGERLRKGKISPLLITTLRLEDKELNLKTHSLKEMKNFSHRIELALNIIKKHSSTSWERFSFFTDSIIPIKDKEFVSYSHQNLPCVSMINLYDRDFVDLMDDLLHENGHHHLNHFLNLEKLIDEPQETIYYSPWRRTLRPLRGIYHAYFTFFWAFKLFSDLASAKSLENPWYKFSDEEKEKIIWRAVEEFHMLAYSFNDLKWAHKKGLITETGWDLILLQNKELAKTKKKILAWEKMLKHHKKELKDLKVSLKFAEKKYKRN